MKLTNEPNVTSPVLHPYPSWQANTIDLSVVPEESDVAAAPLADNSSIISTFRIRVDECDRLWVMDTGLTNRLIRFGNPKQIAPPALVIFNLNTDQLIRRYAFTSSASNGNNKTFYGNVVSSETLDPVYSYKIAFVCVCVFSGCPQHRLLTSRKTSVTMRLRMYRT